MENTENTEEVEDFFSEELVRWMTEGTNPNQAPRSDQG